MQKLQLSADSLLIGKSLGDSGIRDYYNCMLVGVEAGQHALTMISATRKFRPGDIIWVVGEKQSIKKLLADN